MIKLLTITSLSFLMFSCSNDNNQLETLEQKVVDYSSLKLDNIEFIEIEDISIKAIGSNSISDYSQTELENEPTNKRLNCRLVISEDFKAEQTKTTINDFINKITTLDSDIDELSIFLYSDQSLTNGAFDIAMASWLPKSGDVTPEIARMNNHSNYEVKFNIREDLHDYLAQKNVVEDKFGLSQETRQDIYSKLVQAEPRARDDADKLFPPNINIEKNIDKNDELMKKYKKDIRKKYNISEDIEWEIIDEGMKKGWQK